MCDSLFKKSGTAARNQEIAENAAAAQEAARREAQAKADEAARQNTVRTNGSNVNNAFAGFDDGYFDKFKSNYSGYYTPQIDDQYETAKQNLTYNLSSKGLSQSSIGAKLYGDLQKRYDDSKLQVSGAAEDGARALRGNVEKSKNDLYVLAQSASDPESVSTRALASASALTAPQSYTPLGDVFGAALGSAANFIAADAKSLTPQLTGGSTVFSGGARGSGRVVGG